MGTYRSQSSPVKLIGCGGPGCVVPINDSAVTNHRAAEKLHGRVLLRQRKLRHHGSLGDMRHHTTASGVGCLFHPSAKRKSSLLNKIEKLRHGIRTILRVQKRVGERCLLTEIRGGAQQVFQRMPRRQCTKSSDEVADSLICGMDAKTSAELLQHIDTGPSVGRIHHEVHGSVRFQHAAQSSESGIGIRKMMEDSCADNLVVAHPQLRNVLDSKLMDLKIFQVVFMFEFLSTLHTRRAEVDAGDLS